MYIVQRRKNERSDWHTVKSSRGKYQGKSMDAAFLFLKKAVKEYPGKEHRLFDTKTGMPVPPDDYFRL